uniref:C2H2-type domain-containing protein n=1 Tax=Kalanchoe fedtschenkoi TaxID=63787 RepID=A0A7N1A5D4_KALFE
MNLAGDSLRLKPPTLLKSSSFLHSRSSSFALQLDRVSLSPNFDPRRCRIRATASSENLVYDIDMVASRDGVYSAKQKKVVILWDLDNKPPRGPPFQAAMSLRRVAEWFGDIVEMSAYANRHAFIHLPHWVLEERRERRRADVLERKGLVVPSEPYVCSVCGRKWKTNLDLKRHFKQLHERERQKKLNRMNSLKGKKRQKYKERYISGNHKYNEAARELIKPKVGYGLASELRRAGVFVKTVEDKPQAADWALKRQMQHSMSRGIDWLFLISDDSDFTDMLKRAKSANLGTVVVGDFDRALGREADLWIPWLGVENREVEEKDLLLKSRGANYVSSEDGLFSLSYSDSELDRTTSSLDTLMDELAAARTEFTAVRSRRLSGEADNEVDDWAEDELSDEDEDLLWDNEDEETEDEDQFF